MFIEFLFVSIQEHNDIYYHCLVLFDFLSLNTHGSVVLGQVFSELLVWRLLEDGLLPQIRSQVGISGGDSSVGCLSEVAQSSGGSTSGGVTVVNTRHLEQLLGNWSRDDTSSTWSGDESHPDGATLPVTLQGTVWGRPILFPQKPRLTGTMESLERMMAPRIAVATSLEHLTPRPT